MAFSVFFCRAEAYGSDKNDAYSIGDKDDGDLITTSRVGNSN